jgi:hypothetical protein
MSGNGTRPFRDEAHRDTAMLKWLRREVNRDLRYWRSEPGALPHDRYHDLIEDCKAKLAMLSWAEHWQDVRTPEYIRDNYQPDRPDIQATMLDHLHMVNGAMRKVAAGYRDRAGWRREWDVRQVVVVPLRDERLASLTALYHETGSTP